MSEQLLDPIELAEELAGALASRADEADRVGKMPPEDLELLRESGYLALTVPEEFGGFGLSLEETVAAQLELAQGSTSTGLIASMQLHIFGNESEQRTWPEELFAEFCRAVVEDGALFNSVASEPIMGSPSHGRFFRTNALRQADGTLLINGHKNWITGGPYLTHMLVALSLDDKPGVVYVPQNAAGVRWEYTWRNSLSLRASESHDVFYENVVVPAGNQVVPEKQSGANVWFPLIMGATYLAAAISARDSIIRYSLERVPPSLGKPIATLPKIQRQIGEIDIALQSAELLLMQVASEWTGLDEHRVPYGPRIAAAKYHAIEVALEVTEKALRIAGGISIGTDLPLERFFRDVRAGLMHPPTGDAALEAVGRGAFERMGG